MSQDQNQINSFYSITYNLYPSAAVNRRLVRYISKNFMHRGIPRSTLSCMGPTLSSVYQPTWRHVSQSLSWFPSTLSRRPLLRSLSYNSISCYCTRPHRYLSPRRVISISPQDIPTPPLSLSSMQPSTINISVLCFPLFFFAAPEAHVPHCSALSSLLGLCWWWPTETYMSIHVLCCLLHIRVECRVRHHHEPYTNVQ